MIESNADIVATELAAAGAAAVIKVNGVTKTFAGIYQVAVQRNASGRPGPNIISDRYRQSIQVRSEGEAASVGTDEPQGYRLENGFVGTDSLGRHYNQPPFPHWGPAVDEVGGPYVDGVREALPS